MIDVHFEINGKKVSPEEIGNEIEAAVLRMIKENIQKSVGSVYCKEHGEKPKLICKGFSADKLSYTVSGCCDEVINSVLDKLVD